MRRSQVFVSYSHVDREYFVRLKVHLRPFERRGLVDVWSDTKIKSGRRWKQEIQAALERAAVTILLVSADFLASDFVVENELPPLLKAAEAEGVKVLPVVLKPCAFSDFAEISQFQSVNDPLRPVILMPEGEREQIWHDVTATVMTELEEFERKAKRAGVEDGTDKRFDKPPQSRTELAEPDSEPERRLRDLAREFFDSPPEARERAAKRVFQIGGDVPLERVCLLSESILRGERVAAAIALSTHICKNPVLASAKMVREAIARGLDDKESRVRYRYAEILHAEPSLAAVFQVWLQHALRGDSNKAVRRKASAALERVRSTR